MSRRFSYAFYHSKEWKRTRDSYAASKHGLCERCQALGKIVPGVIVHHKQELTPNNITDHDTALGWDNLELVCRQCHADLHRHTYAAMSKSKPIASVRTGFGFDVDGNLIDAGNSEDPHDNGAV